MSLLNIWTASDIKNGQTELAASAAATDTAVQACTGLDAAKKSEWGTWLAGVNSFCAEVPANFFAVGSSEVLVTGKLADQLQQYQKELLAWQQQFSGPVGKGCSFSPMIAVSDSPPVDWNALVKYGSVAAIFVASAVLISKAADTFKLFAPRRA